MKKILRLITSVYSLALTSIFIIFVVEAGISLMVLFFLMPIWIYFFLRIAKVTPILKLVFSKKHYGIMMQAFGVFTFCLTLLIFTANIFNIRQAVQIIFAMIFLPVVIHFTIDVMDLVHQQKKRKRPSTVKLYPIQLQPDTHIVTTFALPKEETDQVKEQQRRAFIKLIAGAGAGVFLTSLLNPAKASAAFFGSVPGPGVLSVKDSNGNKIDPSVKSPTDGFGISNVDSSSYPAFYGFVNKDGAWYILQENPQNTFLYATGASSYSTNWTGRAGLSYGTYDATF